MKKKMEETFDINSIIEEEIPLKEVEKKVDKSKNKKESKTMKEDYSAPVSCLRNERIVVRFIPKTSGIWGNNPKHILSGGMAEGSSIFYVVPKLSSGMYVNVLTDNEKDFLEEIMGLEENALSVYKKEDNFWDSSNEAGINKVRLTKQDNFFNLADPEDYIRYKILLANKDSIAPSIKVLQDSPKVTYKFVIISEGEETNEAKKNMSSTMECYKEFGKIEDNRDVLKLIIQTIDGRPVSAKSKLEFLQTRINELIQNDSKLFLKVIKDPMLDTKVLIQKAIEKGIVSNRGNYLYYREDNTPLCEDGEEPTLNIAAKYLNNPKNQELKFAIEAKLK